MAAAANNNKTPPYPWLTAKTLDDLLAIEDLARISDGAQAACDKILSGGWDVLEALLLPPPADPGSLLDVTKDQCINAFANAICDSFSRAVNYTLVTTHSRARLDKREAELTRMRALTYNVVDNDRTLAELIEDKMKEIGRSTQKNSLENRKRLIFQANEAVVRCRNEVRDGGSGACWDHVFGSLAGVGTIPSARPEDNTQARILHRLEKMCSTRRAANDDMRAFVESKTEAIKAWANERMKPWETETRDQLRKIGDYTAMKNLFGADELIPVFMGSKHQLALVILEALDEW